MNTLLYTTVLLLAITSQCAQSLNILGVFPYQGKSHFFVFKTFLAELANRGHNVTVISHFPRENAPGNYHDISLAGELDIVEDMIPFERSYSTIHSILMFLVNSGRENCEIMLKNNQVQSLVKNKAKFDVIVVEQFNSDCALGLAYKLQAPIVGITSHVLMPWHYQRLGVPYNPAYVPFHFTEGGTKPTFYQRLERKVLDFYFKQLFHFITQNSDQQTIAKYLGEVPPLEEIARDIKFLLIYHNFILTGSRLFPSNVKEVGGYHVGKANPLTGDLKEFMDKAEHGVVYISFGSVVKSSSMSDEKLNGILSALAQLPQKVIWKWEDKTRLKDHKNIFVSSWLPQADILAHPKTRAFLSHAGMLGTTEAIHFGVPVVALPIMGDQPSNAAAIEESGLGVQIQINDLNKENLLAAFRKVLQPEFRERVKQISKAWHDRPMSPMDTAVFWTEFAARNRNFTFRTAAADTPLYQYLNLDILAAFTVFALLPLVIVISCCFKKKPQAVKNKTTKKSKRE